MNFSILFLFLFSIPLFSQNLSFQEECDFSKSPQMKLFLEKDYNNYHVSFSGQFKVSYQYIHEAYIGENIDKYLKFKTFAFDNYENKLIQKSTKEFGSKEEFLKYINSLRIREYILNATECFQQNYEDENSHNKFTEYVFRKSKDIRGVDDTEGCAMGIIDYTITITFIENISTHIQTIDFEFDTPNENEFSIGLIRILNSIRMVDRDEFLEYIPSKGICYWNQKKICLSKSEMSKQLKGKKGIYHLIFYRNEKDEKNIHKKSIIQPTLREIIINNKLTEKEGETKAKTSDSIIKEINEYHSLVGVNESKKSNDNLKIKFTPISMEYTCTKKMKCYIQSIVFNR